MIIVNSAFLRKFKAVEEKILIQGRVQTLRLRLSSYQNKEAWRAVSPVEIATATEPPDAQSDVQR